MSDVCLSVAYIGPKSRTERPRKTKIGSEVTHDTRDSDTTFKVKRSKVKFTRPLYSPPCWRIRHCSGGRGNVLAVGNCCYVAVYLAESTGGGEGRGISWLPPAYSLLGLFHCMLAMTTLAFRGLSAKKQPMLLTRTCRQCRCW